MKVPMLAEIVMPTAKVFRKEFTDLSTTKFTVKSPQMAYHSWQYISSKVWVMAYSSLSRKVMSEDLWEKMTALH